MLLHYYPPIKGSILSVYTFVHFFLKGLSKLSLLYDLAHHLLGVDVMLCLVELQIQYFLAIAFDVKFEEGLDVG